MTRTGRSCSNVFPLPNYVDPTYNYNNVFQSTVEQPRREEILRMDWNISQKTTFYARGIESYEAFKGDFNFVLASNVWPQFPISYQIKSKGLVSTLIHTLQPDADQRVHVRRQSRGADGGPAQSGGH